MMEEETGRILRRHGAMAAGVSAAGEVSQEAWESYAGWIRRGDHAGMEYMARHQELRRDPRLLLENAKSIISLAFPFKPPFYRAKEKGMIACYAYGDDYHDVLRERLGKATEEITASLGGNHRICIDSAPVMERYWAVKSGIGTRGRNGSVIVAGGGNMVFLAEIITTLELLPGPLFIREKTSHGCDSCGSCIRQCPGGAIRSDGTIDSRRCLSYLTIEHRGAWENEEALKATSTPDGKNIVFGCDICLRSCHLNTHTPPTPLPELKPREEVVELTKERIATMTREDFSRIFKGSAIKRCKLAGIKRNIGIKTE